MPSPSRFPPSIESFCAISLRSRATGFEKELTQYPKQLKEPRRLRREEAAYEKLLAALDSDSIVPDRDVRDVLRDLAEIYDRENEHERVITEHEALHGLLGQMGEGESNVR